MDNVSLFKELETRILKMFDPPHQVNRLLIQGTDWVIWPETASNYSPLGHYVNSYQTRGLILEKSDNPHVHMFPSYELLAGGELRKKTVESKKDNDRFWETMYWEVTIPCPPEEEKEIKALYIKGLMQII